MKKLVGIAAVTALVAAGAFADVSVGFSGHGSSHLVEKDVNHYTPKGGEEYKIDPNAKTTADFYSAVELSAQNQEGTIGFYIEAEQYKGFDGVAGNENEYLGGWMFMDEAKAWAKLGWLKFSLGKLRMNELAGSISDWDNGRRDVMSLGKTDIFDRFDVLGCGIEFTPTPIEGLWLGLAFDAGKKGEYAGLRDAKNTFLGFQLGAGFSTDTFQIKAAWFNNGERDDRKSFLEKDDYGNEIYKSNNIKDYIGKLELGFDLNLGESALLEIGAKIPFWSDGKKRTTAFTFIKDEDSYPGYEYEGLTDGEFFQIVAGLKVSSDALAFKAHAGFAGLADFDIDNGGDIKMAPGIFVDASLECAFTPLTLGVNLAWNGAFCENITANVIGAALYVKKDLASDCFIHAGIADKLTLANVKIGGYEVDYTGNKFYIPVGIEYAF
ncbi:MAG: hypothetical protein J1D88_05670 [Treponema sp.]|nr:hypothetical protein [Treponema sp.]